MKLTRREMLEAAMALSLPLGQHLRKVERQTPTGWETVRMADLKKGDIFRIHCPEDAEAHLKPYRATSDGYWCDRDGRTTMEAVSHRMNAGVQAVPA
jgi:hypothetical protein